ncbi:MAG: ergothioneine biosynthesis protein EgtB [Methylosarcina sp.]
MSNDLIQRFALVREHTLSLSRPLSEADMTLQAAEFVSPGSWHLAHTTWFFEEFFLCALNKHWPQSEQYRFLFNSYYEAVGQRQAQGRRGLISRPGLPEILQYRRAIDEAVLKALDKGVNSELEDIIKLGLQHEQQHQELFLTDILYNLAQNPFFPAYRSARPSIRSSSSSSNEMLSFPGGLASIGHDGNGFGFDNEFPRHFFYLEPFQLAQGVVTNAEWIRFIEDGGYKNPLLWLADGWKTVQAENWQSPLYWIRRDGYQSMTLQGLQPLAPEAPVTHISYFEADAFARWAGKRLPTEAEWEVAVQSLRPRGSGDGGDRLASVPAPLDHGEVWEWTSSPYAAYPRFKIRPGAIGEYNGKFMCGQYVLRGGSCATPPGHGRPTYRNFFYPGQRWQFTGLRLAADGPETDRSGLGIHHDAP